MHRVAGIASRQGRTAGDASNNPTNDPHDNPTDFNARCPACRLGSRREQSGPEFDTTQCVAQRDTRGLEPGPERRKLGNRNVRSRMLLGC